MLFRSHVCFSTSNFASESDRPSKSEILKIFFKIHIKIFFISYFFLKEFKYGT